MAEQLRPAERMLRTIRTYVKNKQATMNISATYRANKVLDLIERLQKIFDNGSYKESYVASTMDEAWNLYEVVQKSCDIDGDADDAHGRLVYYGDDLDKVVDAHYNNDGCYHTPVRGSGD